MDNQRAIEFWRLENIWARHKELSRPGKTNSKLTEEIGKIPFYFTESAKDSGVDPISYLRRHRVGVWVGYMERFKLRMLGWKSREHLDLQIPFTSPNSPGNALPLPPIKG